MKHAILIITHKDFCQLLRLIKYFEGKCDIYIHVDKNSSYTKSELARLRNTDGVCAVFQKYHLRWGSFSILKTELLLLNEAVKAGYYKYYHLLSGQDYPIKPFKEFLSFFDKTEAKGFLNCTHLPDPNLDANTLHRLQNFYFTDIFDYKQPKGKERIKKLMIFFNKLGIKKGIPKYLDHIYGGSAWFSIDYDVAKYLLFYTKHKPAFYRRMRTTFVPEEIYVSTVILNSPLRNMVIAKNNCRYILWDRAIDIDSPQYAEMKDLKTLISLSNVFFSRKFDISKSSDIIEALDKYVVYPEQDGVSIKIDFNNYTYDNYLKDELISFCKAMNVKSVLDMGCGCGWYTAYLNQSSINTVGYDTNPKTGEMSALLNNGKECCHVKEISKRLGLEERYDMSICLDSGKSIRVKDIDAIVYNLSTNTDRYILLSLSVEDEDATSFSEEKLVELFRQYGFRKNNYASYHLRQNCFHDKYKKNLILFEKTA